MTTDSVISKATDQAQIIEAIDASQSDLVELSLDIHAHPEVNYQEVYASNLLATTLERRGFQVVRGVGGVPTAFRAELAGGGGPGPRVALLAEYDALPEIGHACGHNLIATAVIGASIGLCAEIDVLPGNVLVIGTTAEEGGGGKIRLLEAGVFADVDMALSCHPAADHTYIPTAIPSDET